MRKVPAKGSTTDAALRAVLLLLAAAATAADAETASPSDRDGAAEASASADRGVGTAAAAGTAEAASGATGLPRWIDPRRATTGRTTSAGSGTEGTGSGDERAAGPEEDGGGDLVAVEGDGGEGRASGLLSWRDARIVLHIPEQNDALPDAIAGLITELGGRLFERRFVSPEIAVDQIRYFHAGDEAAARALASDLSPALGALAIADLTAYRPKPAPGLIELWVR